VELDSAEFIPLDGAAFRLALVPDRRGGLEVGGAGLSVLR
jgi:hypothetical protein